MKKIVIVGTGFVGAHIASSAIYNSIDAEFLMIDRDQACEVAQVLDLKDSLMVSNHSKVACADFGQADVSDADIFIITAGARMAPGETRLDLVGKNTAILKSIKNSIGEIKKETIVIIVSNPVDILTYKASEIFGLPTSQVIGTGTLLDTARLYWRLNQNSKEEVHGYVLGEHGDSSFVAWSLIESAKNFSSEKKTNIEKAIQQQAYKIKEGKGATYFGISSVAVHMISEILNPTGKILPIAVTPNGEYGLKDIAIGLPCILDSKGVKEIVELDLSEEEKESLHKSAEILKSYM